MQQGQILKILVFFMAGFIFIMAPQKLWASSLQELAQSSRNMSKDGIFGYYEFPSHNFDALPQWKDILEDFKTTKPTLNICLQHKGACRSDTMLSLRQIILDNQNKDDFSKLRSINRFFNRWPYQTDMATYNVYEHWAPPFQFMKRSGDCEDYAIAKFFALQFMGFKNSQMRVVTVYDNIRQIGHAVLAVYIDNKILILDSLADGIFNHTLYQHYIPQYSLNEKTRWLHTAPLANSRWNR